MTPVESGCSYPANYRSLTDVRAARRGVLCVEQGLYRSDDVILEINSTIFLNDDNAILKITTLFLETMKLMPCYNRNLCVVEAVY